ncbi:MAG TPA: NADPH-dependent F420 reductase [Armatimonadota bacterium]|nr:NADPH-dependent F420 reductase [Armatimonadota bacterium]HOM81274.1 NADPH-dependent F420 reductase [Armatimonadota bacterium]HPO72858.1 NADPH-dependent F420 reductase [Armatimonadota bacterium]
MSESQLAGFDRHAPCTAARDGLASGRQRRDAMRIGIIGAGMVGGALGKRWASLGHQVLFGVRDPAAPKVKQLLADAGPNACAGSVAEAAAFGPVVVLAVPWSAAREAIQAAGDLTGKILIDPTSPIKRDLSGLDVPEGSSAAEQIAAWAPGARVVKAFNTVSHTAMTDPRFPEGNASVFYAGDDDEAKRVVAELISEIGLTPEECGPLANARLLEVVGLLRMYLAAYAPASVTGVAFRVLRR